ncbi:MAG: hypothetical protein QUU85_00450, partial [Candidatus Eisenbacteria bacterium]|nr:hypothetical protein [Candidatus Eisenbacteria bacterium]
REGGPFRAPADLRRVKGIGPRTVERLAPLLSFEIAPGDSPSFADSSMQIARGARGRPAASGSQPRASSRLP